MAKAGRIVRKIARSRITATILVLLVTISMVSFFSWRGAVPEEQNNLFSLALSESKIDKIILTAGPEQEITLSQSEIGWVVSSQKNLPADQTKVKDTLRVMQDLRVLETEELLPTDREMFGLGATAWRMRLINAGQTIEDLWLGNTGPSFSSAYLRREGENKYYLVSANLDFLIKKGQFLATEIVNLDRQEVVSISWQTNSQKKTLAKAGDSWRLNGQMVAETKLTDFFNLLELVKAEEVAWLTDSTLKSFDYSMTIKTTSQEIILHLRKLNDKTAVIIREQDKRLFKVPLATFNNLQL